MGRPGFSSAAVSASRGGKTMAGKVRVGVVGVGYLGRFHALIYSRMADVELVGVVDADPLRAAEVAAEAGCAVFTDAIGLG